jgi:hypothetical protein
MPVQVAGDQHNPTHQVHKIECVIVDPKKRDEDVGNPNSPTSQPSGSIGQDVTRSQTGVGR